MNLIFVLALITSIAIAVANLDDKVCIVTCNADGVTQGPHLLSENKSFWFSTDEHEYHCWVATANFHFKYWAMEEIPRGDYGWFIQKDGIYNGTFDGKKLVLRYGW